MNVGMLFGIIFAIIVIGFVLYFGYTYIGEYMSIQNEAGLMQQILRLDNAVDEVYNMAYESSKRFSLSLGEGKKVCFVDPQNPSSNPDGGWETNEVLTRMVSGNNHNVVILLPDGRYDNGKEIEHLAPLRSSNFCVEGDSEFLLKNEGKYVSITIRQD
ncbi:MAG: hypothetical protein JW754_05715 [Candidatus Aenigmarchaeota archaeon]|nr:hypothetical protein [Candidatus Aenigmarchaeota archaeon]